MRTFDSDGVEIAFIDEGDPAGAPILLIHGFASNIAANWVDPGWVKLLTGAGYRVVAYDNRGHGRSAKLYATEDYGAPLMAEDARRLLDHLGIERADVMGYSMGARIAAFLALAHPARVRSLVFGGLGLNMVRGVAGTGPVARALEAEQHRRGDQSDRAHLPRLRRADAEATSRRSPPASARRARPSRPRMSARYAARCWSWSASRT